MSVEIDGNVRMRGDPGPGVGVRVVADKGRLRLVSGNELVGDWPIHELGISALQDGFNIRAEGEEFVLRTVDDVAFAEEIGVVAAPPRLARRLATRNNPDVPEPVAAQEISSRLAAIGFSVAGALIVLGGTLLNLAGDAGGATTALSSTDEDSSLDFWLAFIVGGVLMIAMGYVMSIGARWARAAATLVLVLMIGSFGFAVRESDAGNTQLAAYGFIAGGLVVAVAVLVSGSLREPG